MARKKIGRTAVVEPTEPEVRLLDVIRWLIPDFGDDEGLPRWPPDAFALVATVLERSGGYAHVVCQWPPSPGIVSLDEYAKQLRAVGQAWRQAWVDGVPLPSALTTWWSAVVPALPKPLSALRHEHALCEDLLQILAAADEASAGAGIPGSDPAKDENLFDQQSFELLKRVGASSLCSRVHPSRALVLPKLHTPQNGISIRSLSHHLALYHSAETAPVWSVVPSSANSRTLNLLLVPWPYEITPAQFREVVPRRGKLANMPDRYGFFAYEPTKTIDLEWFDRLLNEAERQVDRIDGVVFPELALTQVDYEAILPKVLRKKAFLVAGVGERGTEQATGKNAVCFDVPVYHAPTYYLSVRQEKHHRWCMDGRQVTQYGLGNLDSASFWWEHTDIGPRQLYFVSMRPWLTTCVLICEDLARQGAAADLVRAVAPNLVIALLMDGPQLVTRWPARYAAVLADDPGCSVLSLTSLGMAGLSRVPGKHSEPSRTVALWRDPVKGSVEISVPSNAQAVVLSLSVEQHQEWTADGRDDGGMSGYPVYAGERAIPAV